MVFVLGRIGGGVSFLDDGYNDELSSFGTVHEPLSLFCVFLFNHHCAGTHIMNSALHSIHTVFIRLFVVFLPIYVLLYPTIVFWGRCGRLANATLVCSQALLCVFTPIILSFPYNATLPRIKRTIKHAIIENQETFLSGINE